MRRLVVHYSEEPPMRDDRYGTVLELVNRELCGANGIGLAYVMVDPGAESPEHYHRRTEEVYFVLSGTGVVTIGGVEYPVAQGHAIYLPVNQPHRIRNTGEGQLTFLSADAPPYDVDDDIEL